MTPEEALDRLTKLGEHWVELNAGAGLLEECRKSVRAQKALEYLPAVKGLGKSELMAEANQEYIEHITKMIEARRKANLVKVNVEALKTYLDMDRTRSATLRAELQRLS